MTKLHCPLRPAAVILAFIASTSASAKPYCLMPVYELPQELAHFKDLKVKMYSFDVKKESDVCNEAVYLVGTHADHNIQVEVCPPHRRGCEKRTLHKPMIRGAQIGWPTNGTCEHPTFISQLNDVNYNGDKPLKLCKVSVSWDPASTRNREIAYEEHYMPVGNGLAHLHKGDPNPNYVKPARR